MMDFVLGALESIGAEYFDTLTLSLLVILVALGAMAFEGVFGKTFKSRLSCKRNLCSELFIVIYAILLLIINTFFYIESYLLITALVLLFVYVFVFLLGLRPIYKVGCNFVLRYFQRCLDRGIIYEYQEFFCKDRRLWLLSRDSKLRYELMRARFLKHGGRPDKAFNILSSVKPELLYEDEEERLIFHKAKALSDMGAYKKAVCLYQDKDFEKIEDPQILNIFSLYFENKGELSKALHCLARAKDLTQVSNMSNDSKAMFFNNYGRMLFNVGQKENAFYEMKKAYQLVRESHDMGLYSIVTSNYVSYLSRRSGTEEECKEIISRFREKVLDNPSADNMLEYFNCCLEYCRNHQLTLSMEEVLKTGYYEIICKLNHVSAEVFRASVFRMVMNGGFSSEWLCSDISTSIDDYMGIPLPERLRILSEYDGVFHQEEFHDLLDKSPYDAIFEMVREYYENQAIPDIDAYEMEADCNVSLDIFLRRSRLGIIRRTGKKSVLEMQNDYESLIQYLDNQDLCIEAANIELVYADECLAGELEEKSIVLPIYNRNVIGTYYELGESYLSAPLCFMKVFRGYITDDMMQIGAGYLDKVIRRYDKLENHSFKIPASVEISYLLMKLGRRDEAESFWKFYKEQDISASHAAMWLKTIIRKLSLVFDGTQ